MLHGLTDIPGIEPYIRSGTHNETILGPTYDIKVPTFGATLWRYMDFAKLVSLLEHRALFFARADKLGDPFEGAWSNVNLKYLNMATTLEAKAWRLIVENAKEERRYTLINCWHASDHESEAMWKLYSGLGYGLAVKTDFKTFVHSFTNRTPDLVASVEYISYESQQMPWSLRAPFLHKRLSFKHEQEVRAIITCHNTEPTDRPDVMENYYSTDVCDVGIPFAIDPTDLIQEVVVSPYAESWTFELVQAVCAKYGITAPVRLSSMASGPAW